MALALTLRRGVLLRLERNRRIPRRGGVMSTTLADALGGADIWHCRHGADRDGGGAAGQGVGFRVMFYDPYLPNGVELGLGVLRAKTLEELLRQTDTLSVHTPLTPETRGMLGLRELSLLPKGAVVVNTAGGRSSISMRWRAC